MPNDEDYPTADPYLTTTPGMPVRAACCVACCVVRAARVTSARALTCACTVLLAQTLRDVLEEFLVNKTIFFVGDSINGLVYQAAVRARSPRAPGALTAASLTRRPCAQVCELSRWGLHVYTHDAKGVYPEVEPGLAARVRRYWRAVARLRHLHEATQEGLWLGGLPDAPEVVTDTGTLVLPKGWHKYKASDMAAMMSLADVIVVNYALHYHGPPGKPEEKWSEYEAEMGALFAQLEAFGRLPGKASVFRETGAQHFAGTGAYAGDEQAHPGARRGCHCEAMSPEVLRDNEVTQYNAVIHKLAATHPHVGVLPFYELTAPRHDMHEGAFCAFEQMRENPTADGFCCDCTHLCHTPQLWRHVFANLYDVLAASRIRDDAPR